VATLTEQEWGPYTRTNSAVNPLPGGSRRVRLSIASPLTRRFLQAGRHGVSNYDFDTSLLEHWIEPNEPVTVAGTTRAAVERLCVRYRLSRVAHHSTVWFRA
jgi:hypothetical protein